MFEQETDDLIKIILYRTIEGRSLITVKHILAADIPSMVKNFFRADVEMMLIEEQRQAQKISRFNYEHPEISSLQQQINSILILEYAYPEEIYRERLTDGVHLLLNYLVRPQWTLTGSVFEKSPSVSMGALTRLLRYFEPYRYLQDLLLRYLHEKKITTIDRGTFQSLLWRLDSEYIRRKNGDQLAGILQPLFDLINFLTLGEEPTLPIFALEKYYEDKGLISVVSMLEGVFAQGKVSLTNRELGDLLEDVRRTTGTFTAEEHEAEGMPFSSLPMPADHHLASSTSSPPPTVTKILSFEIEDADRKRFIRKIFKQDGEAFSSALESLRRIPTWKEASRAIDEILITQVIDPYSSDALRFIEVLYQQYHPAS